MDNVDLSNKAKKFWSWFETISESLKQNPTREDLINQIDDHISLFGSFDWELGPYQNDLFFFSISPSLNKDKLALTHQIVSQAPECPGWVFLSSKPVKTWQGIWKMKNHLLREIQIDTNNWEYILYQFEDGTYDMDIKVDDIDGDIDIYHQAVDIALTGYLGEENFMRFIENIRIVDEFEVNVKGNPTKLKYIKKHIESL